LIEQKATEGTVSQGDSDLSNLTSEYRQIREGAGLIDVSHRGKIELVGPDAASFLHNLSTNDIRSLASGAGCEIFLTNAKGKVVAFGWVYRLPNESSAPTFWLDVDPAATGNAIQHLNKYLISEQVEIAERTKEFAQFYLIGAKAGEVLQKASGEDLAGWREMQCGILSLSDSITVQVRFHRRLRADCFEIIIPRGQSDKIFEMIQNAGAGITSLETLEILRVEAGVPTYGIDIDENVLAPEVGRTSQAISYSKGCYLGQETIVRIRDLGHVNRKLMGLKIQGSSTLPRGSKIFREDKEIGEVTSSVLSARLGTGIGLAYLHRSCQTVGTRVEVAAETGRVPAEVASLPFVGSGAN
jgi:folate-binding protein YgfZ